SRDWSSDVCSSDLEIPRNDVLPVRRKYIISANAGMVSKLSRCTPMDSPMMYMIRRSHRSACGSSARFSHFRISQKTAAVHNEDMAYTSDSTAEYQNVSLKA